MTTETPTRLIFWLSLPPSELSSNGGWGSWAPHAEATKAYRVACTLEIRSQARQQDFYLHHAEPLTRARLTIRYVCCSRTKGYKPVDTSNIGPAIKGAQDALLPDRTKLVNRKGRVTVVEQPGAGIVLDDRATCLELGAVTLERHRHRAKQLCTGGGVEFTVEEM
jgi:hypothetical protein